MVRGVLWILVFPIFKTANQYGLIKLMVLTNNIVNCCDIRQKGETENKLYEYLKKSPTTVLYFMRHGFLEHCSHREFERGEGKPDVHYALAQRCRANQDRYRAWERLSPIVGDGHIRLTDVTKPSIRLLPGSRYEKALDPRSFYVRGEDTCLSGHHEDGADCQVAQ